MIRGPLRAPGHRSAGQAAPLLRAALAAAGSPASEALGRSRGGLATKRHLACDGKGRPLSVVLTPG